MKNLLLTIILFAVFVFVGCAPLQINTDIKYPDFENANQCFLEKTIDSINFGSQMEGSIPRGSRVSFISMEKDQTLDKSIIALIEDQVISSLVASGYVVVERDEHLINNLLKEGNQNYSKMYEYSADGVQYLQAAEEIVKPGIAFVETNLKSADYMISYRILESGIVYRDMDVINDGISYVNRDGLVRLHVRVQNAETGDIKYASNLTGTLTDEVRKDFVHQLSSFHYSYFSYEYPLQAPQSEGALKKLKTTKQITVEKSASIKKPSNRVGFAGVTIPSGDLGYLYNTGIHFGFMNTTPLNNVIDWGGMVSYDRFGTEYDYMSFNSITGLLIGKYNISEVAYGISGLGITRSSLSYENYDYEWSDSEDDLTFVFGGGYDIGSLEFIGLYHKIFNSDMFGDDNYSYLTMSAGVNF